MLEITGLRAGYGAINVLWDVDLAVPPGRVAAIVGPNGAGKTTLLRSIAGMIRPSAGSVRFEGSVLSGRPPWEAVARGVSLIPEGRLLFRDMTVEENLRLGFAARRSRAHAGETLANVYELFPIVQEFRGRQAGALSGGQQQQLAIARALVAEPDVLLLDEPSLGLSPNMVDVVFGALEAIRDRGLAVLLVEQRAQRTVALADRSHVL